MNNMMLKSLRRTFDNTHSSILPIPHLLQEQIHSYQRFLQSDVHPLDRQRTGLHEVLRSVFPMRLAKGSIVLDYVDYRIAESAYTIEECKAQNRTFSARLYVTLRMTTYESTETGNIVSGDIVEQQVYLCEIPDMTPSGSFIINGIERVVVGQIHRSPGCFFGTGSPDTDETSTAFFARVIPMQGSWLEVNLDAQGVIHARIDRTRKILVTTLLRALGYTTEHILRAFFSCKAWCLREGLHAMVSVSSPDQIFPFDIQSMDGNITVNATQSIAEHFSHLRPWAIVPVGVFQSNLYGHYLAHDVWSSDGVTCLAQAGDVISQEMLETFNDAKVSKSLVFQTLDIKVDTDNRLNDIARSILTTLDADVVETHADAQSALYKALHKVIDVPKGDVLEKCVHDLFFAPNKYDLSTTGRMQFNRRMHADGDARILYDDIYIKTYLGWREEVHQTSSRIDEGYAWRLAQDTPVAGKGTFITNPLWKNLRRHDVQSCRIFTTHRNEESLIRQVLQHAPGDSDIIDVIRTMIRLAYDTVDTTHTNPTNFDDIDHMGNRRTRYVGEMVQVQFRAGLLKMERALNDKTFSVQDGKTIQNLVDTKVVTGTLMEFFSGQQLSQYMNQENSLSSMSHKRRISALGMGGLSRKHTGLDVRDIHPTHYGRLCPIETPEGANIGIVNALSIYARTNQYGLLETPYRKVVNRQATDEIVHLSAADEGECVIAQAGAVLNSQRLVQCRHRQETLLLPASRVEYMDVSPKQTVSVAAALIPFLEHNDANRALMGSNMQRQAVPLLHTESPLVGTGMESIVARYSGSLVLARRSGTVDSVSASRIVVRRDRNIDIYPLVKYTRSNAGTCLDQRPVVHVGDKVGKGDILADGSDTRHGELALGQNILVAFMPWNGYNFEDSILISERVVEQGRYTSVHIEELVCTARETANGTEEITSDIPGVNRHALLRLDESGIVHMGAQVKAGDILVGKVTPRDNQQPSPEEKLLFAIFGAPASKIKETSLRVPQGMDGTVIDVQILTRPDADLSERAFAIKNAKIDDAKQDMLDRKRVVQETVKLRVRHILMDISISESEIDAHLSGSVNNQWFERIQNMTKKKTRKRVKAVQRWLERKIERLEIQQSDRRKRILNGDILGQGAIQSVKVSLAVKRPIQPGDKLAGRHGNKGVISTIVPVEDMPYMEDGTPVDMVLNPLGVPSRMNIGQILETHLGWAAKGLGEKIRGMLETDISCRKLRKFLKVVYNKHPSLDTINDAQLQTLAENLRNGVPMAAPVFEGASEAEIRDLLMLAGLPSDGKTRLWDGRTGEKFDCPVTVGYMYMLKLNHLVADKMHARSTGSYSLVTQQPLGGKSHFGGQRMGEMEVWALEAHGAAHTLQEMLTFKSDDVPGRSRMYKSIIHGGNDAVRAGVPSSLNVLMNEIRALGLDVELTHKNSEIQHDE